MSDQKKNIPDRAGQSSNSKRPVHHLASIIRPLHPWAGTSDPTLVHFLLALRHWLTGHESAQCLICARTAFEYEKPAAFLLVEFDIENGAPRSLIISGICEECSTRGDAELQRTGLASLFGDDIARKAKVFVDHSGHGGKPS
jgi:hypothetical protein